MILIYVSAFVRPFVPLLLGCAGVAGQSTTPADILLSRPTIHTGTIRTTARLSPTYRPRTMMSRPVTWMPSRVAVSRSSATVPAARWSLCGTATSVCRILPRASTGSDYGIKCVSSEDHSSAAGSVDSVDEKTEETTTEVDASLHVNEIVMSILITLLAVVMVTKYLLPWLRKR